MSARCNCNVFISHCSFSRFNYNNTFHIHFFSSVDPLYGQTYYLFFCQSIINLHEEGLWIMKRIVWMQTQRRKRRRKNDVFLMVCALKKWYKCIVKNLKGFYSKYNKCNRLKLMFHFILFVTLFPNETSLFNVFSYPPKINFLSLIFDCNSINHFHKGSVFSPPL